MLTLTPGTFVRMRSDIESESPGFVESVGERGSGNAKVFWPKREASGWHPVSDLTSAFRIGMEVVHDPAIPSQSSLGWGVVRAIREISNIAQALVEFPDSGQRLWLPWQRLRMVRGIRHAFSVGRFESGDGAERQRLRLLSWAIRLWNENTGALATFDIDPLPHQIHLVHHILASGQYNWLIADDVGLGKTIEVGLLLAALRQRGEARRILLITPAGLTRQWQEEMSGKFGFDEFRIYGDDFHIHEPRHWKMFDNVIGSMDRFKQEDHLECLLQAEPWDLVIVDEAHRLSRRQYGNKLESSQRYELLYKLRPRTDSILLLTATPHQGKQDSFIGLLELLHPERRDELDTISLQPEIIGEMVFRNYKADVTDIEGNFIFHGKTVRQIEVPLSDQAKIFDERLREYLRRGYAAEAADGRTTSRAIGFVMTIYRKLAASSVAAIHAALVRRQARLQGQHQQRLKLVEDERYQGELEESEVTQTQATPFFEGEEELLQKLIDEAASLTEHDTKLQAFMDNLIDTVLAHNNKEKVLIFTEYRSTQSWIQRALNHRFGEASTLLIHGGMDMPERRLAISSFEEEGGAQFLVSTEAGGEGINLQHRCHIMVNYDLPWNPMRLVQRIGRLYRYGQKNRVVVFNMHQRDSADEHILGILYQRLDKVAEDMAMVQRHEYNEAMKEDILGQLADLVDIEDVLVSASQEKVARTSSRIDEALARAREAAGKQHELFQHAAGFDRNETFGKVSITVGHLQAFVEGMASLLKIDIVDRRQNNLVWNLRLPELVREKFGVRNSRWTITFDRMIAARRPDYLPISMNNWFFNGLLEMASRYDFGGVASLSAGMHGDAMLAAVARWQNDRGRRARQELAIIGVDGDRAQINPPWVSDWLQKPVGPVNGVAPAKEVSKKAYELADHRLESMLLDQTNKSLLPDQPQWICGSWQVSEVPR